MAEPGILHLDAWDSCYVIVGGSAGALIGLQFVVLTLVAERPVKGAAGATAAFATPTIVHFGVALLLSLLMRIPWPTAACLAAAWALVGIAGLGYVGVVVRRIRRQIAYAPVAEDWIFHVALPATAYAALVVATGVLHRHPLPALFLVAGAALLLLFIGIHNAWDAVSYHVLQQLTPAHPAQPAVPSPPPADASRAAAAPPSATDPRAAAAPGPGAGH